MTAGLAPIFVIAVVLAVDLWVYVDAKRWADAGTPVTLRVGGIVVDKPVTWFLACLVLWIIFFPMYMVSRSR